MHPFVINAVAPTRICDVGGWTDTHFSKYGTVFNVAIYPYVEVQVHPMAPGESDGRLIVSTENYGTSYTLDPDNIVYDKHPLIEAAIKCMALPQDLALRINVFSYAPPGASMGTSAAVSVALIGALDVLTGKKLVPHELATLAHSIETKELGLECGVQDQLASAYGGINLIEISDFPKATISPIAITDAIWWELEHRLVLTYIGKPHQSSEIHKLVIAGSVLRPIKTSASNDCGNWPIRPGRRSRPGILSNWAESSMRTPPCNAHCIRTLFATRLRTSFPWLAIIRRWAVKSTGPEATVVP